MGEFSERQYETMIAQGLSAEEDGGKNASTPLGVGLEVTFPSSGFGSRAEQPQDEGCEQCA